MRRIFIKNMKIYDFKINGLNRPLGYRLKEIACSFKIGETSANSLVSAQLTVSTSENFSNILYIKKDNINPFSEIIPIKLTPRTRYFVKLEVEAENGESDSAVTWFETAKREEPWRANWIGCKDNDIFPEFNKSFVLTEKVKKARLYICGLGLFEAFLNSTKVGEDVLAPFINDYRYGVQYCVYDVTSFLKESNELTIFLGNGWYKGRFGFFPNGGIFGNRFALIAELYIELENGEEVLIKTDDSWKTRKSFIRSGDIYDGEVQDYAIYGKDNPFIPVTLEEVQYSLVERYSPPLTAKEKISVKEVIKTPKGETVLDFGQNFAGTVCFHGSIEKNKSIQLDFGEILQDGNFYNENYRTAKSRFIYVSDGLPRMVRPRFTYYGFRYVRVSGMYTDKEDFIGLVITSETERVGFLRTGNEKVNRLIENTYWGLKSNFVDMPTDCPQRDERLGWCGDAQVFCRTASYFVDTRAFYNKFLFDLYQDEKRNNGAVAMFMPNFLSGCTASVWGDIATLLPDMLYEYYGDIKALKNHYPLMKDWVDYIIRLDDSHGAKRLWNFGFQYGDWLALDGKEGTRFGATDEYLISSAYYYASTMCVAKAAVLIGNGEDIKYRQIAEQIRSEFIKEYFTANGRLAVDTQTAYYVCLRFGLYPDRNRIIADLKTRIKKDGGKITSGFVGATMMNSVLCEASLSKISYDYLLNEDFPGWLYEVNLGATTIWERWDSVLADGKMSGTEMNSLNHYSYGAVCEFLFRHAAGLIPLDAGFQKIFFAPKIDARLKNLSCSFDSAAGRFEVEWEIKKDGSLKIGLTVPCGASAKILLPDSEKDPFMVSAGKYLFEYQPNRNYFTYFDGETLLSKIVRHEGAMKVVKENIPKLYDALVNEDKEALSRTLNDYKELSLLGYSYNDVELTIQKIKEVIL